MKKIEVLFTDMHRPPQSISFSGFLHITDPDLTLSKYLTFFTFILKSPASQYLFSYFLALFWLPGIGELYRIEFSFVSVA